MRHLDLFSGFGGFRLAVEAVWPESELHAFVEIDPFCQKWLKANWPGCRIISDAKDLLLCEKEGEMEFAQNVELQRKHQADHTVNHATVNGCFCGETLIEKSTGQRGEKTQRKKEQKCLNITEENAFVVEKQQ